MNILEKVRQIIAEELGRDSVDQATTLEELGVDSLEFSALMVAVSRQVGEIPDSEWETLNTVGDIARAAEKYAQVSG